MNKYPRIITCLFMWVCFLNVVFAGDLMIICEEGESGEYSITLNPEIEEDRKFIEALKENFDYFELLLKETEEEEKVEQTVEQQPQGFIKVEKVVWGYPCTTLQAVKKFLDSQPNENSERQAPDIEIFDALAYLYLISEYQAKDSFALPVLRQIRKNFGQFDKETRELIKFLVEDLGLKEKWHAANPLEFEVKGVRFTFVAIPAGTFMFGEVDHLLEVEFTAPFMMMTHEVTQKQWEAIMGNNPSKFKGEDLPVENVSYEDVQIFITQLNKLLAEQSLPGVRLPTEEEWEYAARAGTTANYFWGDDDDESQTRDYSWHRNKLDRKTRKVGELNPNALGLYDMSGNVWEWIDSLWSHDGQIYRVIRGGSCDSTLRSRRSAPRIRFLPGSNGINIGFRLVRSFTL